jgi:hypothetical protein
MRTAAISPTNRRQRPVPNPLQWVERYGNGPRLQIIGSTLADHGQKQATSGRADRGSLTHGPITEADIRRGSAKRPLPSVGSDPEPLLRRGKHLLEARVFADRIEVGVSLEMPNERAAGHEFKIGIKHVQCRIGIA